MAESEEAVAAYLKEKGPSRRRDILAATGVPPGTLAVILLRPRFTHYGFGWWQLAAPPKES